MWLTAFNDVGEAVLSCTANELKAKEVRPYLRALMLSLSFPFASVPRIHNIRLIGLHALG